MPQADQTTARIEDLYKKHGPALNRTATRILGDPFEAGPVVNDIFVKLEERKTDVFDEVSGVTNMGGWLRRLVVNRSIDVKRKRKRLVLSDDFSREASPKDAPGQDALQAVMQRQELGRLTAALQKLPEADRRAVVGHYFEDLTQAELATEFGISREQMNRRLRQIRARLLKILTASESH